MWVTVIKFYTTEINLIQLFFILFCFLGKKISKENGIGSHWSISDQHETFFLFNHGRNILWSDTWGNL